MLSPEIEIKLLFKLAARFTILEIAFKSEVFALKSLKIIYFAN